MLDGKSTTNDKQEEFGAANPKTRYDTSVTNFNVILGLIIVVIFIVAFIVIK
ncbi:hypothetical protein [Acidaminobacter sp. JC074]|uniref:hypothetical protein n=1 Tax=Acidaminobacter sp. JC074 TaxID=2530199 RepID=UPI001F0F9779|nr:hypothetical protein [Acidaminobacter sp. JC074]